MELIIRDNKMKASHLQLLGAMVIDTQALAEKLQPRLVSLPFATCVRTCLERSLNESWYVYLGFAFHQSIWQFLILAFRQLQDRPLP